MKGFKLLWLNTEALYNWMKRAQEVNFSQFIQDCNIDLENTDVTFVDYKGKQRGLPLEKVFNNVIKELQDEK